jgi:hypothetical protein
LTRSRSAARVGSQRPRVCSVPDYLSTSGKEAVEVAAAAGLVLDPWQCFVLEQALGERADHTWAAFEVALLVPRQNGKGAVLKARELAGLFLLGEQLIVHSSHQFKTTQEAFLGIRDLIEGSDDFRRQVKRIRTAHGEEAIEMRSGQRLKFVARSTSSGRGFSGDCVILDEALALTSKMKAALIPTLSARPNPQIWYTSSAGDDTAFELSQIRKRGHEGSPRLAYFEWSVDDDADLDDRDAWRKANPAFGIRIDQDYIEGERAALSADDFARERLGIWRLGSAHRVIPTEPWEAVQSPSAQVAEAGLWFGVDIAPDRASAAIAASDGTTIELIDHRPGVGWIEQRVRELCGRWGGAAAVDGGGPAVSMADAIEAAVRVERLTTAQFAAACARIYDAIMERKVAIRSHTALSSAVSGAARRPAGDRFLWSRSDSTSDVTPLVAATLAYDAAVRYHSESDVADLIW